MDLVPYVFHERQEHDSMMCGQHTLNNLLQQNLFQATDLAELAKQLDSEENMELDVAEKRVKSENMDDSGFFSSQVLDRALSVWNLSLSRWRSPQYTDQHDHPELQEAFVFNLDQHWFTIRRFGGKPSRFYNLNSFLDEPQWVSANYLGMVITQAEEEGYSVFVINSLSGEPLVEGAASVLPACDADQMAQIYEDPSGRGVERARGSLADMIGGTNGRASKSVRDSSSMPAWNDPDADLNAALAASLAESSGAPATTVDNNNPEFDPVAASMARSQARLKAFQEEQAAALRGEDLHFGFDGAGDMMPGSYSSMIRAEGSSSIGFGASGSNTNHDSSSGSGSSSKDEGNLARSRRRQADPSPSIDTDADDIISTQPSSTRTKPKKKKKSGREDEDEQLRRAIIESAREAKGRGEEVDVDAEDDEMGYPEEDDDEEEVVEFDDGIDDYVASPRTNPPNSYDNVTRSGPTIKPQLGRFSGGDRIYDDEDDELQKAIKASMEGLPNGFTLPSPPPRPKGPSPFINSPAVPSTPSVSAPTPVPAPVVQEIQKDADEDEEEVEEQEEREPTAEELRAIRLARFANR